MLQAPRVHGHEIVLDEALPIGGRPVRFASDVDLVGVGRVAVTHDSVPAMFDAYQRTHGVVELPAFVTALSLLLAEGVIE
jgi:hypothetical protein